MTVRKNWHALFDEALRELDRCAYQDCATAPEPADAAAVAQALRAIWGRLDNLERNLGTVARTARDASIGPRRVEQRRLKP